MRYTPTPAHYSLENLELITKDINADIDKLNIFKSMSSAGNRYSSESLVLANGDVVSTEGASDRLKKIKDSIIAGIKRFMAYLRGLVIRYGRKFKDAVIRRIEEAIESGTDYEITLRTGMPSPIVRSDYVVLAHNLQAIEKFLGNDMTSLIARGNLENGQLIDSALEKIITHIKEWKNYTDVGKACPGGFSVVIGGDGVGVRCVTVDMNNDGVKQKVNANLYKQIYEHVKGVAGACSGLEHKLRLVQENEQLLVKSIARDMEIENADDIGRLTRQWTSIMTAITQVFMRTNMFLLNFALMSENAVALKPTN